MVALERFQKKMFFAAAWLVVLLGVQILTQDWISVVLILVIVARLGGVFVILGEELQRA